MEKIQLTKSDVEMPVILLVLCHLYHCANSDWPVPIRWKRFLDAIEMIPYRTWKYSPQSHPQTWLLEELHLIKQDKIVVQIHYELVSLRAYDVIEVWL